MYCVQCSVTLFQCTVHECVMDTNLDSQERLFLLTLIVKQPSSSSLLHVNFRFPNKSLKLSIFSLFLCQYNKAIFYRFYKLQPLLMITIAAAVDDNNNNNICWLLNKLRLVAVKTEVVDDDDDVVDDDVL